MTANPLISISKASDSGLHALLHPLVLLTISDHITRYVLRRRNSPVVGAIIGQQNGREISLEYAFEAKIIQHENGHMMLHEAWFNDRLQQYKEVHKAPALELVGWFTTSPTSGPQMEHIPIHQQILHTYNESAILLAFHPTSVLDGDSVGGKLPLSIYESVYESVAPSGGDTVMQTDSQELPLDFKFKELPYSIETGEAEMISVDFVARGGGNATAVDGAVKKGGKSQASQTPIGEGKTREQGTVKEGNGVEDSSILSAEDEELIAALTARANAVKMLHARIQGLKKYCSNLPPCYLTTPSPPTSNPTAPTTNPSSPETQYTEINHPILRSIQALLNRLPLLIPSDQASFERESLAEKSDVSLISLLGSLGQSIKEAKDLGSKFSVVESARQHAKKGSMSYGAMDLGFMEREKGAGVENEGYILDDREDFGR